jgi:hypothetical protein
MAPVSWSTVLKWPVSTRLNKVVRWKMVKVGSEKKTLAE